MDAIDERTFHYGLDVHDVADYLLQLDSLRPEPDVTPMKLAKLLYLAQANYLAATGRRLFDEPVEAFDHGPVVYREWRRHSGNQIIAVRSDATVSDAVALPDDVADFLDEVWRLHGDKSSSQLRALTHAQAPWRDNHVEGAYRTVIPDEQMAWFFHERVPTNQRVLHPSVVALPSGFLDDIEAYEDVAAEQFAEYLRA